MAQVKINIPGFGETNDEATVVILGPNGSGKTRLAQRIAESDQVSAISAQRKTWVDDELPVQRDEQLRNNINSWQLEWRRTAWQPTGEIIYTLSRIIQEHVNTLIRKNDEEIENDVTLEPVRDTKLMLLQGLWSRLFPYRKLEIEGFFPKVIRLETDSPASSYQIRDMSDGERTVLYMAARVMTAEQPIILVDEPELHMHSRLSVQFWDEAEKLRPDCRFIYVTHDLSFALSRRGAMYLVARSKDQAERIDVDQVPASVAAEVLGAATLPFYAKRIFLFEGESGKGFASEFFSAWFDDKETFAMPAGDRSAVYSAVAGLKAVGVVGAEIIGIVDRDFYSDDVLAAVPDGVMVLQLHEIESLLCDRDVVTAISKHLAKDPDQIWNDFVNRVRNQFIGETLYNVIAQRVRSRIGDLFDGIFSRDQIVADFGQTMDNHVTTIQDICFPEKTKTFFLEESERVSCALDEGEMDMLAVLPGKQLMGILPSVLGMKGNSELISLVVESLRATSSRDNDGLFMLGSKIEKALSEYLPSRRTSAG